MDSSSGNAVIGTPQLMYSLERTQSQLSLAGMRMKKLNTWCNAFGVDELDESSLSELSSSISTKTPSHAFDEYQNRRSQFLARMGQP